MLREARRAVAQFSSYHGRVVGFALLVTVGIGSLIAASVDDVAVTGTAALAALVTVSAVSYHRYAQQRHLWIHNLASLGTAMVGAFALGSALPPWVLLIVLGVFAYTDHALVDIDGNGPMQTYARTLFRRHLPALFIIAGPAINNPEANQPTTYDQVRAAILENEPTTHPTFSVLGIGDILFPAAYCIAVVHTLTPRALHITDVLLVGLFGLAGLIVQVIRLTWDTRERDIAALSVTSAGALTGVFLAALVLPAVSFAVVVVG